MSRPQLSELNITNFALIPRTRLPFRPGLNVLSGETGAGKSIVVDALECILGGRVSDELIRAGADRAVVEGLFDLSAPLPGLDTALEECGLEPAERQLVLSREIVRGGRNIARVNGRAITAGIQRRIGDLLVDVHGQSEHLSLMRPEVQLEYLDRYGGHVELRAQVAEKVRALNAVQAELSRALKNANERARRIDFLRFQVDEIAAARLRDNEDEELAQEHKMLSNAQTLAEHCVVAGDLLSEGEAAVIDRMGRLQTELERLAHLDSSLGPLVQAAEQAAIELEELAGSLRRYSEGLEASPARLTEVEERLDLLHRLRRKYGATVADIQQFGETASRELKELESFEKQSERNEDLRLELLEDVGVLSTKLSRARAETAARLAARMEVEMNALNLPGARFMVDLRQIETPDGAPFGPVADRKGVAYDATGADQIEFLVALNPGEPFASLARTASGGELSRLMLALKSVLASSDETPVLVFDEVDSGIGGRGAQAVAEKLWLLGVGRQVLCITHLPHIACYGDAHYHIVKGQEGGRTVSVATLLEGEERLVEIADMVGGQPITPATRQTAADLLERAAHWKRDQSTPSHAETCAEAAG